MPIPSRAWAAWPWSWPRVSPCFSSPPFAPVPIDPLAWPAMRPFFIAGGLIFLAGLIDDVRGLGPVPKLLFEFAAAAVIMSSGLLIERITLLGWTWPLGWIAWPVTAAWLVGLTNAFNLIDGVDGLAAGITALAGAACGAILVVRGHAPEAMLLAAFVGAALGFLCLQLRAGVDLPRRQRQPGRRIPAGGDGDHRLAEGRDGAGRRRAADDLRAADRRQRAGAGRAAALARPSNGRSIRATLRQIAQPDREHIHHRMLAMGWSVRRTVLILYGITAILSLLALATADVNPP